MNRNVGVFDGHDLQPMIFMNGHNALRISHLSHSPSYRSLGVGVGLGVGLGIGVRAQEKKPFELRFSTLCLRSRPMGDSVLRFAEVVLRECPCGANTPAQAPQEHERVPGVLPVRQRRAQISGEILSRLGCTA